MGRNLQVETLCPDFPSFRTRHGPGGTCRQHVLAIAYLLCGFDRLPEIGRFLRYHLAIKVFGRTAVDQATDRVLAEMTSIGYTAHQHYGVPHALQSAFLIQRSARLDAITPETLRKVASSAQLLIRRATATLSQALMRMGIIECAVDHQNVPAPKPPSGYRASDGVRPEWLDYCQRWRATSTSAPSTREHVYYRILKCGRWLADKHSELAGPADISRAVAIEYVAAVDRMTIGEWANPNANYVQPLRNPLKPRAKASHLSAMRHFIRDLQEWEWIPRRFDPARTLALPRSVRALIGPAPRVVADDQWAKLVWAGMNLGADDVQAAATAGARRRRRIHDALARQMRQQRSVKARGQALGSACAAVATHPEAAVPIAETPDFWVSGDLSFPLGMRRRVHPEWRRGLPREGNPQGPQGCLR
jgi:hypothetical protein